MTPLGFRPEPLLPEAMLASALALNPDEIALVHSEGMEVIPAEAFAPLSRAGVRLAQRGQGWPAGWPRVSDGSPETPPDGQG